MGVIRVAHSYLLLFLCFVLTTRFTRFLDALFFFFTIDLRGKR